EAAHRFGHGGRRHTQLLGEQLGGDLLPGPLLDRPHDLEIVLCDRGQHLGRGGLVTLRHASSLGNRHPGITLSVGSPAVSRSGARRRDTSRVTTPCRGANGYARVKTTAWASTTTPPVAASVK